MTSTAERKADRNKIIKRIYELCDKGVTKKCTIGDIHKPQFGSYDISLIRDLVWYWVQKKYVRAIGKDPSRVRLFYITADGIDYVEKELLKK